MGGSSEDYAHSPLDEGDLHNVAPRSSRSPWSQLWRGDSVFCGIVLIQTLVLAVLALRTPALCGQSCHTITFSNNPLVYTPIQDELQYKIQVFAGNTTISGYEGFNDKSYVGLLSVPGAHAHGLSPILSDAAWQDLYEGTMIMMTDEEASQLPNRTSVTNGAYIGQFDIYRQLHCLDYFRQSLQPDRYVVNYSGGFDKSHLLQCLKSLRESLMCSSDISVMAFQWVENKHQVVGKSAIAHSCRNFNKIREWTRDRALDVKSTNGISGTFNRLPNRR